MSGSLVIPMIIGLEKKSMFLFSLNFVSYCCSCKSNKSSENWKLGKFCKEEVLFEFFFDAI